MIAYRIITSENPDLEIGATVLNKEEAQRYIFNDLLKNHSELKHLDITFKTRELKANERAEVVEKFKRADGQYIYHGDFMSREYIEKEVDKNYQVLTAEVLTSSEDMDISVELERGLARNIFKELTTFAENYRKEVLTLEILPELSTVAVRDQDLAAFTDAVEDFRDTLDAYLHGPGCEGWTKGSDCRTCSNKECLCNRTHNHMRF